MKFLIQTLNGRVKYDFAFTLLESIDFLRWFRNDSTIDYEFTDGDTIPDCIPIGNVGFVQNYLKKYYNLSVKPVNIPDELLGSFFTGRKVFNGTEKDITGRSFVKSNDKIKSFTNICTEAPEGNYQISEVIDIDSEWRAFVYEGRLVGLNNYSGRFDLFPDVIKIKQMIAAYTKQPAAFTLDVAISNEETVVIEVHDFFSCGLYGFDDHNVLPYMYSRWFYQFIQKNKKG